MRNLYALALGIAATVGICISTSPIRAAEEPSAEVKALLVKLKEDLKNRSSPKTRATAYTAIGELKEKAISERRTLCWGMLDPNTVVATAAADALKKVDENMYKLATSIIINESGGAISDVAKLGADGEPMTPIIYWAANKLEIRASHVSDGYRVGAPFRNCLTTLVAIAPEDPDVNRIVIATIKNPAKENRRHALELATKIKNKKLALPNTILVLKSVAEESGNRVYAISIIPELIDENTKEASIKILESIRLDRDPAVRNAVELVTEKLKR